MEEQEIVSKAMPSSPPACFLILTNIQFTLIWAELGSAQIQLVWHLFQISI